MKFENFFLLSALFVVLANNANANLEILENYTNNEVLNFTGNQSDENKVTINGDNVTFENEGTVSVIYDDINRGSFAEKGNGVVVLSRENINVLNNGLLTGKSEFSNDDLYVENQELIGGIHIHTSGNGIYLENSIGKTEVINKGVIKGEFNLKSGKNSLSYVNDDIGVSLNNDAYITSERSGNGLAMEYISDHSDKKINNYGLIKGKVNLIGNSNNFNYVTDKNVNSKIYTDAVISSNKSGNGILSNGDITIENIGVIKGEVELSGGEVNSINAFMHVKEGELESQLQGYTYSFYSGNGILSEKNGNIENNGLIEGSSTLEGQLVESKNTVKNHGGIADISRVSSMTHADIGDNLSGNGILGTHRSGLQTTNKGLIKGSSISKGGFAGDITYYDDMANIDSNSTTNITAQVNIYESGNGVIYSEDIKNSGVILGNVNAK